MTTHDIDAGILIRRVFAASPDKVWRFWASEAGLETWWGPAGFESRVRAPADGATGMTFRSDRMHDAMWTRSAKRGWTQQVDRLVGQLA